MDSRIVISFVRARFARETPQQSTPEEGFIRGREKKAVMEVLDPRRGEKVLDAGCGSGFYSLEIKRREADVVGLDISKGMVEAALRNGVDARVADLENLTFDGRFDKILCAGVLEFCVDPAAVVLNLKKVLDSGGRIVFLVPRKSIISSVYVLFHRLNGLSIRLFSLRAMKDLLSNAGVEVYEARHCGLFSLIVAARG
jgi:SAM-dependent methyltransferase